MKSQTEKIAVDIKDYIPELKQKFIKVVGPTNQMEQILINAAFENYELYLAFRGNDNVISVESTERMKKSGESEHLQLASIALYYDKLTKHFKQGNFIEVDANLLREIFQFYRESMLYFKFQKVAFKAIKTSLSNIINS